MEKLPHWQLQFDADGFCWATLDRADRRSNTLSSTVLEEFGQLLDRLEATPPRGLVIRSGKADGFIAGADVSEFDTLHEATAVAARIRQVHALFDRLEALPCPSVAAIHGFCLGGGLELALACHWRIALERDDTRLGFPESRLGIFPGFGGSWRATQRLGGPRALELMLSARQLRPAAARAIGLIDEVVSRHASLDWAARRALLAGKHSRTPGLLARLSNTTAARTLLTPLFTRQLATKVRREHYPAPYRLIEHWRRHGGDRAAMLEAEALSVGELLVGPTAVNLRRVFHLMERLKSLGHAEDCTVRRVHVVGAGVMGGDIAAWCALKGLEVTLQDSAAPRIDAALARATALFARRLKSPAARLAARARLIGDPAGDGVTRADVVIEAIVEDLAAKQALFAALEPRLAAHALLATNTSALPLTALAAGLRQPQRLIGLHFFNPVAQMPLVEVVHDANTAASTRHRGCAFVGAIGKLPLPCAGTPGFLVNRVLAPYLLAALQRLDAGSSKGTLDAAACAFGMPLGPIELADRVGLDVCRRVADSLGGSTAAKAQLDALLAAGRLGRKSGRGFYVWRHDRPQREAPQAGVDLAALGAELLAPLLAECRAALADGVVADADLLDAGVIFGTGFAPHRGGPLHHLGLA